MSDDYKTERVFSLAGASEFPDGHPMPRRRAYGAYGNAAMPPPVLDQHDVASVLGLAVEALTPDLLRAIQKLLRDASDLRHQLDVVQHHRRQLEDQSDLFPGLPCLNGHAFVRELDAFLQDQSGQSADDWGHVAVIHVAGLDRAVGRWGLATGDTLVRQLWERLHQAALPGEPLAYWGLGSFCWLLIGPDANRRVTSVQDAMRQCQTADILLTVTAGLAPLLAGQGADRALDNADANRIQLTP